MSSIVADDLKFYPLCEDPLCAVIKKEHPLAEKRSVRLEELLEYPFIIETPGCDNDILHLLESCKKKPKTSYSFRDDTLIMAFVKSGLGVTAKGARKWRKLASLRQCGHLFATLISRAQELLRSLHEPPHPLSFRGWGRLTAGGFGEWWLVWGDCPKTRMSLH